MDKSAVSYYCGLMVFLILCNSILIRCQDDEKTDEKSKDDEKTDEKSKYDEQEEQNPTRKTRQQPDDTPKKTDSNNVDPEIEAMLQKIDWTDAYSNAVSDSMMQIMNTAVNALDDSHVACLDAFNGEYVLSDINGNYELIVGLDNLRIDKVQGAEVKKVHYSAATDQIRTEMFIQTIEIIGTYELEGNVPGNEQEYEQEKGDLTLKIDGFDGIVTEDVQIDGESVIVTYYTLNTYDFQSMKSEWSSVDDDSVASFFESYMQDDKDYVQGEVSKIASMYVDSGKPIWFENMADLIMPKEQADQCGSMNSGFPDETDQTDEDDQKYRTHKTDSLDTLSKKGGTNKQNDDDDDDKTKDPEDTKNTDET